MTDTQLDVRKERAETGILPRSKVRIACPRPVEGGSWPTRATLDRACHHLFCWASAQPNPEMKTAKRHVRITASAGVRTNRSLAWAWRRALSTLSGVSPRAKINPG